MPKTSRQSTKPRKKPIAQTEVQEETSIEESQSFGPDKRRYLISAVILTIAAVGIFQIVKSKQAQNNTPPQQTSSTFEATQEAKLIEVYEKEKNVDLNKNFVPRYSVFQDDIIGFKIAYPVGFTAASTDTGVVITPTSGKGSITLTVTGSKGNFTTNTGGLSGKEADILNTAADFIKSTFLTIEPKTYNKTELEKRFSQGNENIGKY